jgi:hypothetical protein
MIPKGVRGNKRSRSETNKIKEEIGALIYSEDPFYTDEEVAARIKSLRELFTDINHNWFQICRNGLVDTLVVANCVCKVVT